MTAQAVVLHLSVQDDDLPARVLTDAFLTRGRLLSIHVPLQADTAVYDLSVQADGSTRIRTSVITGGCGCP